MPRIEPLEPPYSPELQEIFARLMPPGFEPLTLFRVIGRNPRVLRRMQRGGLLDPGSVCVRLRELAIARTTARCGAGYEFGVHAAFFGQAAGLSANDYRAIVQGPQDTRWSEQERLVLRLADALHDDGDVSEELDGALSRAFSEAQRIELVVLCGLYHAVSFACRAFRLSPEPGTEAFASLVHSPSSP